MTLYYYEETTMKEIGLILGVVESRISQIHASAVLHLRARLADFGARKEPPSAQSRQEPIFPPACASPRARLDPCAGIHSLVLSLSVGCMLRYPVSFGPCQRPRLPRLPFYLG